MSDKELSRRNFVRDSATAMAAFTIVPRHVLGRGFRAPSDTLDIACIGVGGIGESDVRGVSVENIYALCDVDARNLERLGQRYPKAKRYRDYREMIDKEGRSFDALTVSTPDHSHAAAVMLGLKAGKHLFCQKPLTRTIHEARVIAQEAGRRPRQATQMGNQGHANEGVRQMREWIENGAIGNVQRVEYWTDRPIWPQGITRPTEMHNAPAHLDWNLWLGPAAERPYHPAHSHFNWRGWWDFGTGALGDMACHIMDASFWILDLRYPMRITAESTQLFPETAPRSSRITFEYPARDGRGPVTVVWRDGSLFPPRPADWSGEQSWPFDNNGQCWVGDKGTLVAGTYADNPRLSDPKRHAELIATPAAIKYPRTEGVYKEWIAACKSGTQPGSSFAQYAAPFTEMVLLGNLAVRMQQPLEMNPGTGEITNATVPEHLLKPTYRAGWTL